MLVSDGNPNDDTYCLISIIMVNLDPQALLFEKRWCVAFLTVTSKTLEFARQSHLKWVFLRGRPLCWETTKWYLKNGWSISPKNGYSEHPDSWTNSLVREQLPGTPRVVSEFSDDCGIVTTEGGQRCRTDHDFRILCKVFCQSLCDMDWHGICCNLFGEEFLRLRDWFCKGLFIKIWMGIANTEIDVNPYKHYGMGGANRAMFGLHVIPSSRSWTHVGRRQLFEWT